MKVRIAEVERFISDCLRAVGANVSPAKEQAALLTYADRMGHPAHGLSTLGLYINLIKNKVCKPNNLPEIVKKETSTALVKTNNVLGGTLGSFAMDLATKKADATGVGWVGVGGSIHNTEPYAYWTQRTVHQGLIGLVFNLSLPFPALTRTHQRYTLQSQSDEVLISRVTAVAELLEHNSLEITEDDDLVSWFSENKSDCFVAINPVCFMLGFTRNGHCWSDLDLVDDISPEAILSLNGISKDVNDDCSIHYSAQLIASSAMLAQSLYVRPMDITET